MITIVTSILGVLLSAVGIWFKYLRPRPSAADKVARTDHAMLQDAVNRVDAGDVSNRMRRGDF